MLDDTVQDSGHVRALDRSRDLDSVQALRALAATSVVLAHIRFVQMGFFGVDVFFVVSGFIMCYVSGTSARDFLLKRVFRIVPLYWIGTLAVALVALAAPRALKSTSFDLLALVQSLFFVPYVRADGATMPMLFLGWTLEYEMFFYLLFTLALAWSVRYAHLIVIGMLVTVAVLGAALQPTSVVLAFYSKPVILEFGFGILAFLVWNRYREWFRRPPTLVVALAVTVAYLSLILIDRGFARGLHVPSFILWCGPSLALLLACLALEGRFTFPAWVLAIGNASYSLYLFHPYVIRAIDRGALSLDRVTPRRLVVATLTVLLCFPVALISFALFERPSNIYLRRLFLKKSLARPASVPRPLNPQLDRDQYIGPART